MKFLKIKYLFIINNHARINEFLLKFICIYMFLKYDFAKFNTFDFVEAIFGMIC